MPFLFAVIGLLVGATLGSIYGAIPSAIAGALVGVLWGLHLKLAGRVDTLAKQLRPDAGPDTASAEDPMSHPGATLVKAPPTDKEAALPVPSTPALRQAPDLGGPSSTDDPSSDAPSPDGRSPGGLPPSVASASPEKADTPARKSAPSRKPPMTQQQPGLLQDIETWIREFFTGGNLLVKVGVVVLFFGLAFLVKYTADLGLFPIELRLAAVALGGIVMTGIGWRLRDTQRGYGLILQGGGIAVLYLTVFAGFRLYHLLPAGLAFALLVLLVVFSGAMAVLQNARAIAVMGAAGGFLAPVLASTGSGSHIALFSYYLLLNAGILSIAWFKSWRELNLIGFLFTFVIGALWGAQYYRPEFLWSSELFLLAFFLVFVAIAVLFASRQPPKLKGIVDGTLVFGTPLVVFGLQTQLVDQFEFGLGFSAIGFAFFYVALAWWLLRRAGDSFRLLGEAFLATGVVFATVAVPLAVDARWTAATWALEGAAIVWVGVRQSRLLPRLFGVALQFLAGCAFLSSDVLGRHEYAFFNPQYLGAFIITIAALFSAWYIHRAKDNVYLFERILALVIGAWGLLWWFGSGSVEIVQRFDDDYFFGALLVFYGLSVFVSRVLEWRLDFSVFRYPVYAMLPALYLLLGLSLFEFKQPFENLGFLGWPAAFAGFYFALRGLDRKPGATFTKLLHGAALWLLVAVLSWQLNYYFDTWFNVDVWSALAFSLTPALALMAITWGVSEKRWPTAEYPNTYLALGSIPIAIALALVTFAINVAPPGLPWAISYVPILNPIDLTTGFAVLALLRWWQRCREFEGESNWIGRSQKLLLAVALSAAFLWFNAVLIRSLHAYAGVPYDLSAMFQSTLVQSSLAVYWAITGLAGMVLGTSRQMRGVWFAGATLMGAVVLKLFLVDLANTETVARIVSFVTVGVLMLVVGYFAPVPPRKKDALGDDRMVTEGSQ